MNPMHTNINCSPVMGYELIIYEGKEKGGMRPFKFAESAEGILVRDRKVGPAELALMPKLKVIVRYGVGYDNIDLEAARERSVRVANVQGYANHSVSDHALALMFACTRNLQGKRTRILWRSSQERDPGIAKPYPGHHRSWQDRESAGPEGHLPL